ncbi:MAG: Fe-S cluster assembly ATPase SufC [Patescibacteria group bacterium]|jgi:Fe-S cluster assembly ATP-binding protein
MSVEIKNLSVAVAGKPIIEKISLTINRGETHIIMGPNGSGKSTLANALLGHPKYTVTSGKIFVDDIDITAKPPDYRAKQGLFLSAQQAPEINGVTVAHFLRVASSSLSGKPENPFTFYESLKKTMKKLNIDPSFATRYLNAGFSGGEKKRAEILQLLTLNPTYAILDETDAGLDVDALKIVGKGLGKFATKDKALIIITHQSRLLKYLKPDFVHIMIRGKIVKSGGKELITEIEKSGYNKYI